MLFGPTARSLVVAVLFFANAARADKGCTCWTEIGVERGNGTTEYPGVEGYGPDEAPTITLAPGETVRVYTSCQGDCNGWSELLKNGVPVPGTPGCEGMTWCVTEPGYYFSWCGAPDQAFPAAFIISPAPAATLNIGLWLEGAYDTNTGLMRDDLRAAGLIPDYGVFWAPVVMSYPIYTPFTIGSVAYPGYYPRTASPSVFSATGPNAIVDHVRVEFRDPATPSNVRLLVYAFVQRDGDVVALDGVSPFSAIIDPGSYYIAVRHRNHLGVMTAAPVTIGSTPVTVDFRSASTPTYGTDARKVQGMQRLLWCGNAKVPGTWTTPVVKYTGADNDRDPILTRIGGTTPTNTAAGYYVEDVNLDGVVKYTGANNDRDPILVNIGGTVPTNVRMEQIP
jgi:hypothetical protein